MQVIHTLVIDFARPYKTNTILITMGDDRSRTCRFVLMNNGKPFDMEDVTVATIKAKQPNSVSSDGTVLDPVVYGAADIVEDSDGNPINEITYTLPADITNIPGKTVMTITLMSTTTQRLTSFEFYLNIRNELYSEDDYAGQDSLAGFRDLLNRAAAAIAKVEAMTEAEKLPNPYSVYFHLRNQTIEYSGVETVDVDFDEVVYLGSKRVECTPIAW